MTDSARPAPDRDLASRLLPLLSTPLAEQRGRKLPWDDPAFSVRMLREHLDQTHDHASRRLAVVDAHVGWIFETILGGRPGAVVDLGCGPGLYTERLAELGCRCIGVDFSPASIAYARRVAEERGLDCAYLHHDVRTADVGTGHDLEMLLFGEINTFAPDDVASLLGRVARRLRAGGRILLEVHTFDSLVDEGNRPNSWYCSDGGLFSDRPHVVIQEHAWNETTATAHARSVVIDNSGELTEYAEVLYAHTDDDYRRMLMEAGFQEPTFTEGMGQSRHDAMVVITARSVVGGS